MPNRTDDIIGYILHGIMIVAALAFVGVLFWGLT